jgi:hypothetical protein
LSLYREGEPLEEPGNNPANPDWIERFCRIVDQHLMREQLPLKEAAEDENPDNHA